MKKSLISVVALLAFSTAVMADGASAYQKCSVCHGAKGEKAAMGASKLLDTMKKAEIVAALKGYKDGSYGGAMKGAMKGQVKDLSDADIKAIADLIGK